MKQHGMACCGNLFWVSLATYRITFKLEEIRRIIVYHHRKIQSKMIINHEVTRVVKHGKDCMITKYKLEKFGLIYFFPKCANYDITHLRLVFICSLQSPGSSSLATVAMANSNHLSAQSNRCGIVWKELSTEFSDHCYEKYTRVRRSLA